MKGIRHGVIPAASTWSAAQNALAGKIQTFKETESLNRNKSIFRTSGNKPTSCGEQGRYSKTVELDHQQQNPLGDS
jgi:hypothetical protein